MKLFPFCALLILLLSCKKEELPNPPQSINDTTTQYNEGFGKMITFSDTMFMINASDGAILFREPSPLVLLGSVHGCVTIEDSILYQPSSQVLTAINIYNGKLLFRSVYSLIFYSNNLGAGNVPSWPAIDGDRIYVSSYDLLDGFIKLYCQDKHNGHVIWQSCIPMSSSGQENPSFPTPVFYKDKVIVNRYFKSYYAGPACFDKTTGTVLWNLSDPKKLDGLNNFPLNYKDQVLVISASGTNKVMGLNPSNGQILWETTLPESPMNKEMYTFHDQLELFCRSSDGMTLYVLDLNSGNLIRSLPLPEQYEVKMEEQYLYTQAGTKVITKWDWNTGAKLWSQQFYSLINIPTVTDQYLYCIDKVENQFYQNKIYVINKNTGAVIKENLVNYGPLVGKIIVSNPDGRTFTTPKVAYF